MTNALTGAVAAVYVSDPAAPLTTFTTINLVDQGDHKSWAAAFNYRYWKTGEVFLIEKQIHGSGGWSDITSLCTFDYLRGMITLAGALNADDLVRASGKRVPARKLDEQLGYSLKPKKDKIEVTSIDSAMWKEFLQGHKEWQVTAKKHHVQEQTWRLYTESSHSRLLTSGGNANSHLLYYCEDAGVGGDALSIELINPGAPGSLSISVISNAVAITLAYTAGITSTALQVAAAIEASAACKAIGFRSRIADDETGAGIVAALGHTHLADGGVDTNIPAMIVMFVEDGTSKQNFAGWGHLNQINVDMDIKNAQAEDLTFDGTGKFVWETYSP